MNDPFVSIIMRSYNEAWALRETLPALAAQEYRNWELIVIDSGSTDGSAELLEKANPRHFVRIRAQDYNPSRVMNHGMQLARSEFGIFLNADATPVDSNWLRALVMALQDPKTAAVFGRQIPRPDCRAVYAHDYQRCFGQTRESAGWEHFFSMVSSGLRKDIWSKRGFLEKMQYSEDDEYTRWCRAQGYKVGYCPESVVVHSHNYTPGQAYKRSFGEARALAAVWERDPSEVNWWRTFCLGWLNDLRRDFLYCARSRRLHEFPHAAGIRFQQRRARVAGFRDGWGFYREHQEVHNLSRVQQSVMTRDAGQDLSMVVNTPTPNANGVPSVSSDKRARFTNDGSDALEARLARICDQVRQGIQRIIPSRKLHALVLGGGYGRGEGGVLRTRTGDEPYNDIEFYVFVRHGRLWHQRRYAAALCALERELSQASGLHVEFKLDSLQHLRTRPISMFTHDLVSAHRVLAGAEGVFRGCEHHLRSEDIPLSEATRLLYNRCGGLLLVRELLGQPTLAEEQSDFIGRNLAKASLALGDAVLATGGQYHWSTRIRAERIAEFADTGGVPELAALQKHHRAGVEFKFHPERILKRPEEFRLEHREISLLAKHLWLWIEERRLGRSFTGINDYALSDINKCPETMPGKNYLLTMRTFGPAAAMGSLADRYPRERLFNSFPLLLWNGEVSREPEIRRHLQKQLRSRACDWAGLVAAYKKIWPPYG